MVLLFAPEVAKVITPKTKLLILDSPSNPTGGVTPPEECAKLLDLGKKHNIWLMAMSAIRTSPMEQQTVLRREPAQFENHVIIIGLHSKLSR